MVRAADAQSATCPWQLSRARSSVCSDRTAQARVRSSAFLPAIWRRVGPGRSRRPRRGDGFARRAPSYQLRAGKDAPLYDHSPIYSGYFGLLLFGAALVGTGLLASALTGNQVVAALISLSVFLLLWIVDNFGWLLPSPFDTLVVNLSLSVHFRPFAVG